jgi:hypothetical protein
MTDLINIKIRSAELYLKYKEGQLSLENYIQKMRPLDKKIAPIRTSSS